VRQTWTDERVVVGGTAVHVRRAGGARLRPAVVLHDAGAESVDAPAWTRLAEQVPVVQVLLPGVGGSDPPPPGTDMAWVTALVAGVLGHVGARPGVLVGTSLGGWFALETALAHPGAVGGLVLLDPAGLQRPPGYLLGLLAAGQGQAGQDGLIGRLMARHRAGAGRAAAAPYVAGLTAAALHSWSPATPDPSLLVRAADLSVPTAVLWGARDALIPVAHGRALVRAIGSAASLEVVPGAGHLLAVDVPGLVAVRVTDLIARAGLPSAPSCPSTSTD
jgi:pimeloyl-ACP methyl ester carboxylesterase